MIAMRVVNNVEQEMIKAEWENWLLDENVRCKQVQRMLQEDKSNTSPSLQAEGAQSQQISSIQSTKGRRLEELRRWHESYCRSCKLEQDNMLDGRKHLAYD